MTASLPPNAAEPGPDRPTPVARSPIRTPHRAWFHACFALLAIVAALLLVLLVRQRPGWVESPLVGKSAPRLQGRDTLGQAFDTHSRRGQSIVLGFAAMDCLPSLDALAAWGSIRANLPDAARSCVVACCLRGSADAVNRFMQDAPATYPVLTSPARAVIQAYQVEGIPRTVLIGPDGRVARVYEGYRPDMVTQIGEAVRRLVAEYHPSDP